MVTPHLPPVQAANALLPVQLAGELSLEGAAATFISYSTADPSPPTPHTVTRVPKRGNSFLARSVLGAAVTAGRIMLQARRSVARADIVHLHSNGLIVEAAGDVARRLRRPYVITLYGTDVWHHSHVHHRRFARVVQEASHRAFYSHALLEFARQLDLAPEPSSVIYAPVTSDFHGETDERRAALKQSLGVDDAPMLLTVKRLHPVAGYHDFIHAMPAIVSHQPNVRLLIAGEGELRATLESQIAEVGMQDHIQLLGLVPNQELQRYYAAADLFVLPSHLESWGTVMLEALACGTPVVASNTAGASEVRSLFEEDVQLFPLGDTAALSRAVLDRLARPTRVHAATRSSLENQFSTSGCLRQYLTVYRQALAG